MSFEKDLMSTGLSMKRERPKSDSNHFLIDYASCVDRTEPQKGKKEMSGKNRMEERIERKSAYTRERAVGLP